MLDGVRDFDSPGQLGLKGSYLPKGLGFPLLNVINGNQGGMVLPMGPSNGSLYFEDKPTGIASLSWVHGNHTFKTGLDYRRDDWTNRQYNQAIGNYSFSNAQTILPSTTVNPVSGGGVGYVYASFLLGMVNSATLAPPYDPQYRRPSYSLFLQDTWKITRKLTLDYGIRWDLVKPTREIHDRWSEFAPTVANPAAGGLLGATIYEGTGPGRCNCRFVNGLSLCHRATPRRCLSDHPQDGAACRMGYHLHASRLVRLSRRRQLSRHRLEHHHLGTKQRLGVCPSVEPRLAVHLGPTPQRVVRPWNRPQLGQVNNPPNLIDPNAGRPGRIMQWNISLQREVTPTCWWKPPTSAAAPHG